MKILDAAFAHPRGLLGRLGGTIMARGSAERNAWTIAQLSLHSGNLFLDVGCGPGTLIHALAEHTPDGFVAGIDTSPLMLKQATRRSMSQPSYRDRTLAHTTRVHAGWALQAGSMPARSAPVM